MQKILYVDDEAINLEMFAINLGDKYSVHTAISGSEGLEVLRSNPDISVVLSDMKMPRMNGLEFIGEAKKLFPHIKCIIITGFDITPEIATALLNKTINKYLCKPIRANDVERAIGEVCQ